MAPKNADAATTEPATAVDVEAEKAKALEAFAKAHLGPLVARINALESEVTALRAAAAKEG